MRRVTLGLARQGRRTPDGGRRPAQFYELSQSGGRAAHAHVFEDDWEDLLHVEDEALLRRRRLGLAPTAIAALTAALFGFGVVVLACAQSADPSVQTAALGATSAAQWVDIVRPFEMFSLEAPELSGAARLYRARRNSLGGRQDILGYGNLPGRELFLRLTAYRPGSEDAAPTSFFVDLVRSAATAGLSLGHNLQPQESATRLGLFEIADLDLVEQNGTATSCLGFRSVESTAPVRLSGFACGARNKPLSRPGLVCLIERLDLISAGEDQPLAHFFAAAELKRNPACAGTALAPTPARSNWLDQADARPPLRLKKTR